MNPRSNNLNWWALPAPYWNTAEAGAGDAGDADAASQSDATDSGGEGSPSVEEDGGQSGDAPSSTSLVSDGDKANSEDENGNGEGDEDASFVPLTAENIELPEGVELAEEPMERFLGIMNNQELDRGKLAQELINLQVSLAQEAQDAATNAGQQLWDDTQTQWQKEARALPEIGGDNLPQTLATIKAGLTEMGADDATFEALNVTGAGNHPALIKVLFNLTKDLVETPPVNGDAGGQKGKLTQAQIMFGRDHN